MITPPPFGGASLMKPALLSIAAACSLITGSAMPVKAHPVLAFDKAIGLMYYHARVPNQRGVCTYADDAMTAAIQLWDQDKVREVNKMQIKFDC